MSSSLIWSFQGRRRKGLTWCLIILLPAPVRLRAVSFAWGHCDGAGDEKKFNSALGARNCVNVTTMSHVKVVKARVAIGGARSVIGTVAPLDQEGLQLEVDCDLTHHTGPSLGPAAVSSALTQWLVFAHPFTDELVQFLSGFHRDCLCLHQVHAQDMCGFRSRVDWVHPAGHHCCAKGSVCLP